jgi:outer membrane immunogenic protein
MAGGTLGYNYQLGAWLVGVETDLSWTNIYGSGRETALAPVAGLPNQIQGTAIVDQRMKYFGTVRGRLGWLPFNSLLVYATGGFAYGRVETTATLSGAVFGTCGLGVAGVGDCPILSSVLQNSTVRSGYTVGGGAEYAMLYGWSLKAEYLYFNLGESASGTTQLALLSNGCPCLTGGGLAPFATSAVSTRTSDFRGNIVRVGLNYQFNSVVGAAPVVPK